MTEGSVRLFIVSLLVSLGANAAVAGTIWFRDGRIIEAETWWEDEGTFYYEQFGGEIGIPKEEVTRIEGTSKPRHPGIGLQLENQPRPEWPSSPPPVAAPAPAPAGTEPAPPPTSGPSPADIRASREA